MAQGRLVEINRERNRLVNLYQKNSIPEKDLDENPRIFGDNVDMGAYEFQGVIYVDDDGGADYTSIQDAIDAASSGYTIYVYSGFYNEVVYIDKSINLIGQNKTNTIILRISFIIPSSLRFSILFLKNLLQV